MVPLTGFATGGGPHARIVSLCINTAGEITRMTVRRSTWIMDGKITDSPGIPDEARAWQFMNEKGAVRLTASPAGTEVRWVVASPHVLSLFAAEALLGELQGPFMLRFYVGGWFEERFDSGGEAADRIRSLVMHADRHLTSRIFVQSAEPHSATVPEPLLEVWREQAVARDDAVECRYEADLDGFVVRHVGARSAIGRIWGTDPTSFPCLATGALGRNASLSYSKAVSLGAPLYEQVLAALRFPDQSLNWVPYHRVILPVACAGASPVVLVASEYAQVDFRVL